MEGFNGFCLDELRFIDYRNHYEKKINLDEFVQKNQRRDQAFQSSSKSPFERSNTRSFTEGSGRSANPFTKGSGGATGFSKSPFERSKTSFAGRGGGNPFTSNNNSKTPFGRSSDRKNTFGQGGSSSKNPFSRSGTSKSPFGGSKTTSPFSKSDSKNPFGTGRTVNNVSRTNPFGSGSSNKNPFGTKPSTSTTFNRGASNTDFIKMLEVLSKKNPYGLEKIKKDSSYNLNYGFTGQMNEHTFPLSNQNDIDKPISMKLGFKSTPIDLSRPITGSVDPEKQSKTISDPHWRDEHFLKPRDTLRDRKSFGSISYIDSNKQNNRDLSQPDLKETEEMIRYYTQKKPRLHQNSRIISPDNTTTRNIGVESSLPRNCIEVNIECHIEENKEILPPIRAKLTRTVEDIIETAVKMLGKKYYGIKTDNCTILNGSSILLNEYVLSECDIPSGRLLTMIVCPDNQIAKLEEDKESLCGEQLVDYDLVKGLSVQDLQTKPSFHEIIRMSEQQAQRVEKFEIFNQFGKIVWEGITDLISILNPEGYTFTCLDEVIEIKHSSLAIYEDTAVKPPVGEGLNRPCVITLYDLYPHEIKSELKQAKILTKEQVRIYDQFKFNLRDIVRKKGGIFLSYQGSKGELKFSVDQF
ncbi:unnamed protein product [Moneuplotes crassus]|uniref:Peptidase S59 domain-containing protein n=1 Tax=Euplotes crassus TaxID=5936 RepID=A0AAD1Y8A9_EUPCR|nr:unnamed protein product [Moneuplotes crassus]